MLTLKFHTTHNLTRDRIFVVAAITVGGMLLWSAMHENREQILRITIKKLEMFSRIQN